MLHAGTYTIDIEPQCSLDSGRWILRGINLFERTVLANVSPPVAIETPWLGLTSELMDVNLDSLKTIIPLPTISYQTLKTPQIELNDDTKNGMTAKVHHLWLALVGSTVVLVAIVVIIIVGCKYSTRRKYRRSNLRAKYNAQRQSVDIGDENSLPGSDNAIDEIV